MQSDKELQKEIDKIVAVLSNADADWKVRTDALGKIQRLVYGGATELESFHSLFHKLKEPLEIQVRYHVYPMCVTTPALRSTFGSGEGGMCNIGSVIYGAQRRL